MEENKKNNVILSILCLFLALACMLALLSVGEDTATDPDNKDTVEDTGSDGTNSGDDSSVVEPETNEAYYLSGDIGYRTVGNVTTFFLVCENPELDKSFPDQYYSTWEIWIDKTLLESVGNYVVDIRYSYDYGTTWATMPDYMEIESAYGLHLLRTENPVYISYTFISNCKSPKNVLSDLRADVFTAQSDLNSGLGSIYGNILYYTNFPVIVQNTPIVPTDL